MRVYFIPGAFEDLKTGNYQGLLAMYKGLGYEPVFVKIDWPRKTFDDYIEQAQSQIPKEDLEKSILTGYSWGAMLALILAAEYARPKQLLLFSLSPYFAEDFPRKKSRESWIGHRRVSAFKKLYISKLATKIKSPAILFIGSEEIKKYADMDNRSKDAHKRIKGSHLIVVDGAKHDVTDSRYKKSIEQALKSLVQ